MSLRLPGPLIDGEWLETRLNRPGLVVLEVDEQPLIYATGHIPGARNVDWRRQLQDPVTRDVPDRDAMQRTWADLGISRESTVVLYGDKNNWYACFGYWLFRYYGFGRLAILDGGRQLWLAEGRRTTREVPASRASATPPAARAQQSLRAGWREVLERRESTVLVDVRTPAEFRGEILTEPGYAAEGAQRAGHVPGSRNIPWDVATQPDGRFVSPDELARIYASEGVTLDRQVIAYCRIGERSAHTWFVLHELLGHASVRNYDGSWAEWGSMIGMPVALGAAADAERGERAA